MDFTAFRHVMGVAEAPKPRKTSVELRETYTMVEEIGKGAYGTVSKARHRARHLLFAVKHIDKKLAGSKGLKEVMNEVETMQLLSHPHIVHLEEVYQDENNLWLVMDYVPGGELHSMLRQRGGRLPEPVVRRMAFNVLLALDYLHGKGIVHRDLKPANCLVNEIQENVFELKLADFGFAVMVGEDSCLTAYCGTMAYMAPEVVQDRNYGKPVDMWALGVMLFLLLSGEYPFWSDNADNLPSIICAATYTFGKEAWRGISGGAKDFISKLLDADPASRLTATDALRHPWIKATLTSSGMHVDADDDENEPTPADSPNTTRTLLLAKAEQRRRRLRTVLRGAVHAVRAAHRLVFRARLLALERDGLSQPVMRSFGFLVSRRYEPATSSLSGRAICAGSTKAVMQLVAMLEAGPRIETFDVGNNGIDNLEVIQAIAKACTTHPSLTALHLDGNPVPPLAGRTLQRLARSAPRLRVINVSNTTIGADQAAQISAALKEADKKRSESGPTVSITSPVGSPSYGASSPAAASALGTGIPPRGRSTLTSPASGAVRPPLAATTGSLAHGGVRTPSQQRSRSGRR